MRGFPGGFVVHSAPLPRHTGAGQDLFSVTDDPPRVAFALTVQIATEYTSGPWLTEPLRSLTLPPVYGSRR